MTTRRAEQILRLLTIIDVAALLMGLAALVLLTLHMTGCYEQAKARAHKDLCLIYQPENYENHDDHYDKRGEPVWHTRS